MIPCAAVVYMWEAKSEVTLCILVITCSLCCRCDLSCLFPIHYVPGDQVNLCASSLFLDRGV